MEEHNCKDIKKIMQKLDQHEQLIVQLVGIIAATNKRITNMSDEQPLSEKVYLHS